MQNLPIKDYHEFYVRSHKDLEMSMSILVTPILLPTRVIL